MKKINEKLFRRPLYKIGDIVVYQKYTNEDQMLEVIQSKIVKSHGLLQPDDNDDKLDWYYETEELKEEGGDDLGESDIFYKL